MLITTKNENDMQICPTTNKLEFILNILIRFSGVLNPTKYHLTENKSCKFAILIKGI